MESSRSLIDNLSESPAFFDRLGPILQKEMILASHRKWNYALRSLYTVVMMIIVGYAFYKLRILDIVVNSPVARVAAMSNMGLHLTMIICMFQFFTLQLIAPILTASVISEEIRKQTLATLMLTPISGLQIVLGKLFSRMLVMILLLATSFPLLAILRVFGGVEWRLLLAFESLTFFAALFSASLSLMFSTLFKKHSRDPAFAVFLFLLTIYLIIPLLVMAVMSYYDNQPGKETLFSWFNPIFTAIMMTYKALDPRFSTGYPGLSDPWIQCSLLLIFTVMIILISAMLVRRQALRQAVGAITVRPLNTPDINEKFLSTPESRLLNWAMDYPVLWREWKKSLSVSRFKRNLSIFFSLAILLGVYAYFWKDLQESKPHIFFVGAFYILILAHAASASASSITREKESNTLEYLRLTPLTSKDIVYQKSFGLAIKIVAIIAFLLIHLVFFAFTGAITFLNVLQALIILVGPLFFITCTGINFSIRSKSNQTSVSANQFLGIVLWAPCCCPLGTMSTFSLYFFNPFILMGSCFVDEFMLPIWNIPITPSLTTLFVTLISMLYILFGILILNNAVKVFPRYINVQHNNG